MLAIQQFIGEILKCISNICRLLVFLGSQYHCRHLPYWLVMTWLNCMLL